MWEPCSCGKIRWTFRNYFINLPPFSPLAKVAKGVYRTHILMYLSMKMIYSLREPYDPPKGEIFKLRTGMSMLVAFSLEEVDDLEMGPDLTPREDIRTDIL